MGKSAKISALLPQWEGRGVDPHYAGYFDCFNRGLYYEAHDVLEQLWLPVRLGPGGNFYKGLIQLAGAFVHLQKNRLRPAAALFKLAEANLARFAPRHAALDVTAVLALITDWLHELERGGFTQNPLAFRPAPQLGLPQA